MVVTLHFPPSVLSRHVASGPGRPGEEYAMRVALTLPVLIGLFLVALGLLEARMCGACADADGACVQRAASVTPLRKQVHRLGSDGNEADIDRRDSGRSSEGRGPWTCR
jgi:hypothetical protein